SRTVPDIVPTGACAAAVVAARMARHVPTSAFLIGSPSRPKLDVDYESDPLKYGQFYWIGHQSVAESAHAFGPDHEYLQLPSAISHDTNFCFRTAGINRRRGTAAKRPRRAGADSRRRYGAFAGGACLQPPD